MPTNIKPRLVTCLTCHYDVESDEANPKCSRCKKPLYTVNFSAVDGRRITPGGDREPAPFPSWIPG